MNTGSQAIALGMIIMIMMLTGIVVFVVFGAEPNTTQLNIDCDLMMYSDNWTLGYLRNVSRYCSNGGGQ